MAEVDFQLALLLQHIFDKENKIVNQNVSDVELAKSLQDQFQTEVQIDHPVQNLVYNSKKNKDADSTKSLTDPSWELIDPTPDIHLLFVAFSEKFFWNKLLAVCVSWSKRMTSCAGICSYQGKGGMCTITLSEPLLKLRPRKDLVETLLHEMIHAYLFVTHNNRDRDGHGPEFCKHMYRINAEAGTNITIYHDFHDEVRLYQQHWWKCDGPCQNWKPYFGIIRRATNRTPGPTDRWWGQHSRSCGGTFTKIKEPEKPAKNTRKQPEIKRTIPNSNITDFFSKTQSHTPNFNKKLPNASHNTTRSSNASVNRIVGFKDIKDNGNTGIKGGIRNSSTIVKNDTKKNRTNEVQKPNVKNTTTVGGRVLNEGACNSNSLDYSAVRNHWVNKFKNSEFDVTVVSGIKRKSSVIHENILKSPKLSAEMCECPICSKKVSISEINKHVDYCLTEKECIICAKILAAKDYEKHVLECTNKNLSEDVFEVSDIEIICDRCKKTIDGDLIEHQKICKLEGKQCCICDKFVPETAYDLHVEQCLQKLYDESIRISQSNEEVNCLGCSKRIPRSSLNCHLDNCISLGKIFDENNEPTEYVPESDDVIQ